MSDHSSFFPSFSSPTSAWYREKREEQWSARSQEIDHEPSFDSDEESHESKAITIYRYSSSGLSSLESSPLVPWPENSSYLPSSSSKSLVLHPRGNSLTQEGPLTAQCEATSLRVSNSLVIGERPRAVGLKDVDLSRNVMAKHIREAKERNKSPKKSNFRSPFDSGGQKSVEVTGEKPRQVIQADEEVSLKSNKGYMKMGVLFALFVLLLSIYLRKNPHGFCLDSEFSKKISGIGQALEAEVYGQHIAQKVVTSALKNHFTKRNARKPLVLSFHGWTGVGKNFVTSIITEHLFKHKSPSPFVHKFIVPIHFPHDSEIDKYNEQLRSWIQGNISQCSKGGLFIFDDMDKIHLGMMSTIKDIILGYRGKEIRAGYQNMVFIFLSNSGGHAVNQHVLKHALDGKVRQSLMLKELELIFQGMIKQTPDAWFADLLKSDVIDHLVPFLPLERTHVKQCIRRDLIMKGFHVREALVTEIAEQMEYFPDGHGFFSVSGCKKVSSRVDVIVG